MTDYKTESWYNDIPQDLRGFVPGCMKEDPEFAELPQKWKEKVLRDQKQIKNEQEKNQVLQKSSRKEGRDKVTFQEQLAELDKTGHSKIYENQRKVAKEIVAKLLHFLSMLCVASCQVGKTGTQVAVVDEWLKDDDNYVDNAFIITGLSSIDWVRQNKGRFPKIMKDNISHRPGLTKLSQKIKEKKNILIIVDEVHLACLKTQTLSKMLFDTLTPEYMRENNIKVVYFSATPNQIQEYQELHPEYADVVRMEPGNGYKGIDYFKEKERMFESVRLGILDDGENLTKKSENGIKELVRKLIDYYTTCNKYHIIRVHPNDEMETIKSNIECLFENEIKCMGGFEFKKYTMDKESNSLTGIEEIGNIQSFLKNKPKKHTFIFIKGKLRCSITIMKKHLGILYDSPSYDDSVVAQSLPGRVCGYEGYDYKNLPTIFTQKEACNRITDNYSQGNQENLNTRNLKKKNGKTIKEAKNKPFNAEQGDNLMWQTRDELVKECYETLEEAQEYVKTKLKSQKKLTVHDKNKNSDGFYTEAIRTSGKREVMTAERAKTSGGICKKSKHGCRMKVCYEDINDKSTIRYVIIHNKLS